MTNDQIASLIDSSYKDLLVSISVLIQEAEDTFSSKKIDSINKKLSAKIKEAQAKSRIFSDSLIKDSYQIGMDEAISKASAQGFNISANFTKKNKQVLDFLLNKASSDLTRSNNSYLSSVTSYFDMLKMSIEEKKAMKDFLTDQFFEKGMSIDAGVKSFSSSVGDSLKGGYFLAGTKRMPLDAYLKTVLTTLSRAATSRATEQVLIDNDIRHVKISSHKSKDWCSLYEGKVFSLSKNAIDGYPSISLLPGGGTPFHPNCAHVELPFVSSLNTLNPQDLIVDNSFLSKDYKVLNKLHGQLTSNKQKVGTKNVNP